MFSHKIFSLIECTGRCIDIADYKISQQNLLKALEGEQDAIVFYQRLGKMTDDEQNKDIIGDIGNDEIKHFRNFTDLYIKLYKKRPPLPEVNRPQIQNFESGVKKAILDELDAYEFYRNIYINNVNPDVKRAFYEAMTDEIEHASKLNYIFTKTVEKKA